MSELVPQDIPASIFPLPTSAILPLPQHSGDENPSSPSSSRGKRKQQFDNASSHRQRSSPSKASNVSDFSNALKAKVKADYGNECWHCGASPVDVCHIIGNRDETVITKRRPFRKHLLTTLISSLWTLLRMDSLTLSPKVIPKIQLHYAELATGISMIFIILPFSFFRPTSVTS